MIEAVSTRARGLGPVRVERIHLASFVRRLDWILLGAVAALLGFGLWAIAGITKNDITGVSRSRAASASAHGAWTRAPNGLRMQTRQSPISSRKRSTTMVRSEGTAPVAAACSRRKVIRFPAARSSRKWRAVSRSSACSSESATSSREARPIASPSS